MAQSLGSEPYPFAARRRSPPLLMNLAGRSADGTYLTAVRSSPQGDGRRRRPWGILRETGDRRPEDVGKRRWTWG